MIRNSLAFLTLALGAGVAAAGPLQTSHSFTTNSNTAYTYTTGKAQTHGLVVGFNFSYTGNLEGNDFLGLWFGNAGNTKAYQGPNIGLKANCGQTSLTPTCFDDLFARIGGNAGGFNFANSDLVEGESYYLMAHLYKSSATGNYDRFDAWLNPSVAQMSSLTGADLKLTGNTGMKSIDTIGFRTAYLNNNVTVNVNGLRLNEVPEPGTLALMGLAVAGLAAARRKRA